MKRTIAILVFLLILILVALAEEKVSVDYHGLYGIPEATRIKKEERLFGFAGSRLIGSSAANLGAYPYFGGLVITLTTGAVSVCGSSLVTHSKLLTAAHCWRTDAHQAQLFTVVLGSIRLFSGGTRISTRDVEVHSSNVPSSLNYDVAIITISRVEFNSYIQPIALASGDQDYVGTWAQAAGFGKTSDLQQVIPRSACLGSVSLRVISNAQCLRTFAARFVIASTLCTSGAEGGGPCSGDSGGPLVIGSKENATLIGITSFSSVRGCQLGLPSGFSRVTALYGWIRARL